MAGGAVAVADCYAYGFRYGYVVGLPLCKADNFAVIAHNAHPGKGGDGRGRHPVQVFARGVVLDGGDRLPAYLNTFYFLSANFNHNLNSCGCITYG